ncbi:basic proline-rich protein-like [Tympanuchus pallidicinctus]|uniref:basic proline-rich protein-like n=1 Tax=Tympanuchus pallidicinctus TaxID=109042 RepID=UPI0022871B1E|nr:basic proline-rich protein-like [Tympanuchus pallidicinctus]
MPRPYMAVLRGLPGGPAAQGSRPPAPIAAGARLAAGSAGANGTGGEEGPPGSAQRPSQPRIEVGAVARARINRKDGFVVKAQRYNYGGDVSGSSARSVCCAQAASQGPPAQLGPSAPPPAFSRPLLPYRTSQWASRSRGSGNEPPGANGGGKFQVKAAGWHRRALREGRPCDSRDPSRRGRSRAAPPVTAATGSSRASRAWHNSAPPHLAPCGRLRTGRGWDTRTAQHGATARTGRATPGARQTRAQEEEEAGAPPDFPQPQRPSESAQSRSRTGSSPRGSGESSAGSVLPRPPPSQPPFSTEPASASPPSPTLLRRLLGPHVPSSHSPAPPRPHIESSSPTPPLLLGHLHGRDPQLSSAAATTGTNGTTGPAVTPPPGPRSVPPDRRSPPRPPSPAPRRSGLAAAGLPALLFLLRPRSQLKALRSPPALPLPFFFRGDTSGGPRSASPPSAGARGADMTAAGRAPRRPLPIGPGPPRLRLRLRLRLGPGSGLPPSVRRRRKVSPEPEPGRSLRPRRAAGGPGPGPPLRPSAPPVRRWGSRPRSHLQEGLSG